MRWSGFFDLVSGVRNCKLVVLCFSSAASIGVHAQAPTGVEPAGEAVDAGPACEVQVQSCEQRRAALQERLDAAAARIRTLEEVQQADATRLQALEAELEEVRTAAARAEAASQAAAQRLRALEAEQAELAAQRERLRERLAQAREEQARLKQQEARLRGLLEQARSERRALEDRLQRLERDLEAARRSWTATRTGLEARLAARERELGAARTRIERMEEELAAALAALPPEAGGSASAASAREQAATAGRAYLGLWARTSPAQRPRSAELARARARLFHAQALLAGLERARGVYVVTPEDTLSRIAARLLRDGNAWVRIHRANRHVLPDPDRLTPGVTLIVP